MDTYIKMCEEAEQIQREWKPKEGDYFYGYEWSDKAWKDRDLETKNISELATKEIHLLYFSGDDFESCFPMGEEIGEGKNKPDLTKSFWLPTEEQLWNMPKKKLPVYVCFAEECFIIINKGLEIEWHFAGNNLKECLIQYVMMGNYGKEWNKEKEKWEKK